MKSFSIIALLFVALFTFGCATSETAPNAAEEAASAVGDSGEGDTAAPTKTAYEGSTGSGLLMERYKSGDISGYRD